MTELFSQIESCGYVCVAGPLENNIAYMQLKVALEATQNVVRVPIDVEQEEVYILRRMTEAGYDITPTMLAAIEEARYDYLVTVGVITGDDE